MPTLPEAPSPPVAICELTPITRPAASSSGPPELPGLIAASVWMTSSIAKPLGRGDAALERGHDAGGERALEPERVADRDRRVADADGAGVAERERVQVDLLGVDRQHREVGVGVLADHARRDRAVVGEGDADVERGGDDVRVGEDVAACSSSTKPEPVEMFSCWRGKTSNGDWVCCTERARM